MSAARSALVIDSSRQSGVLSRFCSSAWRSRSSQASGCSIIIRPSPSSAARSIDVVQPVGVVGVGHQRRFGAQRLADGAHVLHVGARLDLDLDLAIAARQRRPRLFDQRLGARLDAQRDADGMRVARAADSLRDSEIPSVRAAISQAAISTAAFAMLWPRIFSSSTGWISSGPPKSRPSTRGATHSRIAIQAVSGVSGL